MFSAVDRGEAPPLTAAEFLDQTAATLRPSQLRIDQLGGDLAATGRPALPVEAGAPPEPAESAPTGSGSGGSGGGSGGDDGGDDAGPKGGDAERRGQVSFLEFAPAAWAYLRESVYHVDTSAYINSMSQDGPDSGTKLLRALANFSEAKGGGFFFFSPDKRYMVKSLSTEEHATLLGMLPAYVAHMTKHPASLITRIHGAYRITMYGQQQHFLVMDALFHGMPEMAEVFDLKGSWVDRHAKRGAATLLDHDWPRSKHLNVSAAAADTMLKQAGHDARFFANCGVMDYSLLLGVHHVTEHRVLRERSGQLLTRRSLSSQGAMQGLLESPSVRATQSGALSAGGEAEGEGCVTPGGCVTPAAAPQLGADTTPFGSAASVAHELHEGPRSYSAVSLEGPGLYRLGIIDLLQRWNWKKRGERYAKVFFKCRCRESVREGMSVLEPRRYAVRFFESVGIKLLGYTLAQVRAVWAEQEEAIAREEQSRAEELSRAEGHSSPSRRPPTRAASATELAEWTGTGQPPCPEAWQ